MSGLNSVRAMGRRTGQQDDQDRALCLTSGQARTCVPCLLASSLNCLRQVRTFTAMWKLGPGYGKWGLMVGSVFRRIYRDVRSEGWSKVRGGAWTCIALSGGRVGC